MEFALTPAFYLRLKHVGLPVVVVAREKNIRRGIANKGGGRRQHRGREVSLGFMMRDPSVKPLWTNSKPYGGVFFANVTGSGDDVAEGRSRREKQPG